MGRDRDPAPYSPLSSHPSNANTYLDVYYLGDPSDKNAIQQFKQATRRASQSLEGRTERINSEIQRLWAYGDGYGATNPYSDIRGPLRAPDTEEGNIRMVKFILKEPSEDDPIFGGGFVISSPRRIPKSKKSKLISQSTMDEQKPLDPKDDMEPTQK